MRIQSVIFTVMASFCVLLLSACGGPHEAEERYFLVSANIKVPYWQTARSGFLDAASKMRVRAEFVGPNTYDPQAQVEAFRDAVRQGPSGILVSVTDPSLLGPEIDRAVAAGIPVVSIDADAPDSQRTLFVGTNNYQAGLTGGRIAAEALGGKGNLVVFTMPEQTNLAERLNGYREAFRAHPGIRIVEVVDIQGDPRRAFDATAKILNERNKEVDGFICLEALAGKEVAEVLDRAKAQNKVVVAMDTDEGTLQWIERGVIRATIAQKPYTMGYFGLETLDQLYHDRINPADTGLLRGPRSPVPSFVDTGAILVNKQNLANFRQPAPQ